MSNVLHTLSRNKSRLGIQDKSAHNDLRRRATRLLLIFWDGLTALTEGRMEPRRRTARTKDAPALAGPLEHHLHTTE